ncbi:hypothetical protein JKY72_02205 [Candidatus Gracilibacteria bacterium]|nr:hypothetical protein [Candidatus Gracilibacteria bacterium]
MNKVTQFALALAITAATVGCSKDATKNTAQEGHISEVQGTRSYEKFNEHISCLRTAFADSAEGVTGNTTLPKECSGIAKKIEKALASKHPQSAIVAIRDELALNEKVICKGDKYPVSWTKEYQTSGNNMEEGQWMKEEAKTDDSRVIKHRYGKGKKTARKKDGYNNDYIQHGEKPFTETKLIITAAETCPGDDDQLLATQ